MEPSAMIACTRLPLVLALALVLPAAGHSQSPLPTVPVDSGREVRAELPSEIVRGRLLTRYVPGDSSMRVCVSPAWRCGGGGDASNTRELQTRAMLRLAVQRGTEARKGAIIGGVIGTLLGGFYGLMVAGLCDAASCPSLGQGVLVGGVAGGAAVGLLGYGIGNSFTRWGPAP
jgi:hypothetical protein